MNICLQNDWKDFGNTVDLFRHEILHGLGFGTLNVIEEHKKSLVKDETYIWNTRNGPRKAARVYMDYSKAAVPVVQRHFGCSNIRGVEAENTAKIHLNEYIFGNELMTPFLSRFNYFSEISAAILESTFIGNVQWYKVDRRVIEMENQNYWYGRNWGCEFALRSCFDYIAEMQRQRKTTFPFCSLAESRVNKAKICFVDLQSPRRLPMQFVSTCEPINANVMPLSVQRLSSVEKEAVDQLTRHCPFITASLIR